MVVWFEAVSIAIVFLKEIESWKFFFFLQSIVVFRLSSDGCVELTWWVGFLMKCNGFGPATTSLSSGSKHTTTSQNWFGIFKTFQFAIRFDRLEGSPRLSLYLCRSFRKVFVWY